MLKLFLFVFGPIFLFLFLTRNFFNPFKLTFLLGDKGVGKSTLMAKLMLKYQKRGWLIYTDMPDCNIPGVRIFNPKDLGQFIPPPYSAVFMDEVGISYDNRKWESFTPEQRDYWKFLRKYKNVAFMNSQAFDIDVKIRAVVDSILLLSQIRNCITVIRPIYTTVTLTEPSAQGEARVAKMYKFAPPWNWKLNWMPKYWKYFDSFAAPHKEELPYTENPL